MLSGLLVKLRFQPGRESVKCGAIGPWRAAGRHHPGANLADHFFPSLGVVGDARRVKLIQRQARGFRALVVAGDAVLVEQRAILR